MQEAGDGLDKLGQDVKSGAVTSEHDLKMAFAKADQLSAKAWQETMAASKKVGQGTKATAEDVDNWFKHLGEGIEDVNRNLQ